MNDMIHKWSRGLHLMACAQASLLGLMLIMGGCSYSEQTPHESDPTNSEAADTQSGSEAEVASAHQHSDAVSDKHGEMQHALPEESPQASAERIPVQLAMWDDVKQWLAQQHGKFVLIDVWSTSCTICLREFPHVIALQKRYPEQLRVVALNCDYVGIKNRSPEYYLEKVTNVLIKLQAEGLQHFLCTQPSDELFDVLGIQAMPAVFVYDRQGQLVKRFVDGSSDLGEDKELSYERHIIPFVEQLVRGESQTASE